MGEPRMRKGTDSRCNAGYKSEGGGEKLRGESGLVASLACMVFGNGAQSRQQQLRREIECRNLNKGIWSPKHLRCG